MSMADSTPSLGIFTTDEHLLIRTWDAWLAAATGLPARDVQGKSLIDLIPDLESRGILKKFQQVLEEGSVQILVPVFHRYLIPCPPVTPSDHFDRMQQRVTIMPLRDGKRIVGTLVSVEDVTARLDRESQPFPDKNDVKTGKAILPAKDISPSSDATPLLQAIGDQSWRVRKEAVHGLIEHGGQEAITALLRTLQGEHANFSALNSALEVLTFSRVDVLPPLLELLEDTDPDLRNYVAQMLGDKGDTRAVSTLLKALTDSNTNVCYHAVEALGKLRAVESIEPLLEIIDSGDFYLSFPAIESLRVIGDPRVAPRLVPFLKDDFLRAPIAELLGSLGDEEVVQPLVDLLNEPGAQATVLSQSLMALRDRYAALYNEGNHIADLAARRINATGTRNLLDALPQAQEEEIRSFATVLGWLEGPAVEQALTRLLGHPKARTEVVEALIRYGGRVTELLTAQLQSDDLEIRYAAAIALGRIGDPRAVPALVRMLEKDPELTIVAAGALAKIGDRQAYDALLKMMGHAKTAVRQAVISALNSLGHPQMADDMERLMTHADPRVRESAVKIAGYFGFQQCVPKLLDLARDSEEEIRRCAIEHLPYLEEDAADALVIHAIQNDTPKVRAVAAKAMAHLDSSKARGPLFAALDDPDPWVRYFAARSVSKHGYADMGERVQAMAASDPAAHVRIESIKAMGLLDGEKAVPVLASFADDEDTNIACTAIRALGAIGPPHALPALLQALHAGKPSLKMAVVHALGENRSRETAETLQWLAASENDEEVVTAAAGELARMSMPESIAALVNLCADPRRRDKMVSALSTLSERDVPLLGAHLSHPQWQVKRAVIEALTRIKRPSASRYLMEALDNPESKVRLSAVRALGKLGNRHGRERIVQMALNDSNLDVRREARRTLEKL